MRIRVLLALIVLAVALGGAVMRHVNTNGSPLLSTIALVLQRDFGKSFMSHLTFAMAA